MIYRCDLATIMDKAIDAEMTFMISKSGIPAKYNLYFARHDGVHNNSVRLSYHENEGTVYQYADEEHPKMPFKTVPLLIEYVESELNK
jgi:hypothetical protein